SIIFSLSVLYFQRLNFYLIVLLSFLCAVAVLIRLPNIIAVPIVLLGIVFRGKVQNGTYLVKQPLLYLLLFVFFTLFGYMVFYSNFEELFRASANSSSHDLKLLTYNYLQHGLKILLI